MSVNPGRRRFLGGAAAAGVAASSMNMDILKAESLSNELLSDHY